MEQLYPASGQNLTPRNAGGNFYGINAVGTTRLVVDDDRREITGSEVADFLHAATIAILDSAA